VLFRRKAVVPTVDKVVMAMFVALLFAHCAQRNQSCTMPLLICMSLIVIFSILLELARLPTFLRRMTNLESSSVYLIAECASSAPIEILPQKLPDSLINGPALPKFVYSGQFGIPK
jgi:hypothetical protein